MKLLSAITTQRYFFFVIFAEPACAGAHMRKCFSPPCRKSGQFQDKARVGRKHSACLLIMLSVDFCPLHSISSGCGVRLYLSCFAFVRNVRQMIRKRLHTFVVMLIPERSHRKQTNYYADKHERSQKNYQLMPGDF